MTSGWFATRRLEPGVHLVSEPVHVNSFLVEGSATAALIDTGLGIGNIREAAESLVSRDVFAINTHYHFDHTGGNHWFARRLIHALGAEATMRPRDSAHYRAYCLYIRELLEALPRFEDLDRCFFHFLTDETTPRPLPEDFDADQWHYRATAPTEVLHEGDRVDLGDRELTVLHTPGHTPDSICLLDEKSGVLFGGDTVNSGPIYAQQPDSDLNAFATSARRLAELVPMIRVVYVAHFQRYALDPGFLVEMADGFERVASGGARLRRTVDYGGSPVQEAAFQRFSILIAPVGA